MARDHGHDKSKKSKSKKWKQIVLPKLLVQGISEIVATAMLLCFGCMGCIATDSMELPHHVPAISFGLVVMIVIMIFGHISGAHINPAVTLSSVILGMLTPLTGVVYVISQFIGSVLGFGLLKILVPAEYTRNERFNAATNQTVHEIGLCTTFVNPKVSLVQALGLEVICTMTLVLVCCAVWDKRNSHNTDSLTLRFGLTISSFAMFAGPISGASMNTVRSFAPALYNKDWDKHWIYWVGPTIGSIVGTLFYKMVFSSHEDDSEDDEDQGEDIPLKEKMNAI